MNHVTAAFLDFTQRNPQSVAALQSLAASLLETSPDNARRALADHLQRKLRGYLLANNGFTEELLAAAMLDIDFEAVAGHFFAR